MYKNIAFFRNEKIALFLISIVFLSLTLPNIHFPGLQDDEAYSGVSAFYIIHDRPLKIGQSMKIRLFNRNFPIMVGKYIGPIESYLLVPFFLLFGIGVFSLRLMPITIALITLLLVYYLCKAWFDKRMALITVLLIATNSAFVQYSRVGIYRAELFQIFFLWAGLLSLWGYFEKKKDFYLYFGFFLFGLGLSAKIMFLWYLSGLVIACLILRKRIFSVVSIKFSQLIIGLSSFALGSFFILFYNFKRDGETIKLLLNSLFQPTYKGFNNLAYLDNLKIRVSQLIETLLGNIDEKKAWSIWETIPLDYISPIIFALGFVFILLFSFPKSSYPYSRDKILFFYILYSVVFLCTPFTISHLGTGHLFILFPFPQIVMALFLCWLSYLFSKKKIILYPIYCVFLASILFNVRLNVNYHLDMRKTGCFETWTTAVYDLADYLRENKISNLLTFHWGMQHNVAFLTDCDVMPVPMLGSQEECLSVYNRFLVNNDIFYIARGPFDLSPKEREELFSRLGKIAKGYNKELVLNKIFYNRSGVPVYYLYKVH